MDQQTTVPSHPAGRKEALRHRVLTVIGIVLCVILVPILLINITLIVRSYTNQGEVPSVGGVFPMIVLTDSMDPVIKAGDLILCHTAEAEEIQVGDVISFFDPEGNGTSVVTHQVIEVINEGGLQFRTKGVANNAADKFPVPAKNLVGIYKTRIPGAGHVAMFMQTTAGLIVCVILPLILLVGYDLIRRRSYEKTRQQDTNALLAELEALKAEKAKAQTTAPEGKTNGESDTMRQ